MKLSDDNRIHALLVGKMCAVSFYKNKRKLLQVIELNVPVGAMWILAMEIHLLLNSSPEMRARKNFQNAEETLHRDYQIQFNKLI